VRTRAALAVVGLVGVFVLSACDQPRPCAQWGQSVILIPMTVGKSTTLIPHVVPYCERYEDVPKR